jgi:hypothetical protein
MLDFPSQVRKAQQTFLMQPALDVALDEGIGLVAEIQTIALVNCFQEQPEVDFIDFFQ